MEHSKWNDINAFESSFFDRIKIMAGYIFEGASVLDLGCGPMWLKKVLPNNCNYYPVDYIQRSFDTIVCDFNAKEFPAVDVDIFFCSGILEYIEDLPLFIKQMARYSRRCIASYNIAEHSAPFARKELEWVNSFYRDELLSLFQKNGYKLDDSNMDYNQDGEDIYSFLKR